MRWMWNLGFVLGAVGVWGTSQAKPLACAPDAVKQARKLLNFHVGGDDRIEIDATSVKELPRLANPAEPEQQFRVLEVWGYIYKGQYRMRFIYYDTAHLHCVLMGQEILEHARL